MCNLSLLEESQEIGRWERDIDKEREGTRGEIKKEKEEWKHEIL